MEQQETTYQQLAPSMKFDGFNPYYHCRLEYDRQDKTRVLGRWMYGEFTAVKTGHAGTQ